MSYAHLRKENLLTCITVRTLQDPRDWRIKEQRRPRWADASVAGPGHVRSGSFPRTRSEVRPWVHSLWIYDALVTVRSIGQLRIILVRH